jgi:signal transduction histidine kinase
MILQAPLVPCPDTRIMFAVSVVVVVSVVVFTAAVVVTLLRRSDRRRAEEEKVAAIGAAAARILHQIKNPLQSVVLNADILQDSRMVADEASRREVCGAIVGESQRLVDMLDELSAYVSGAPRKLARAPMRLDLLLTQLVRQERRDDGPELTLQVAGPATVAGDPCYLSQVFENLIRNAREAMEGRAGGRIAITLALAGGVVEVRVSDNGPGIAPEAAEGLFQPFVSSKGKGMGLGLAICREIVEGHGGRLELDPTAGSGAVFVARLPLTEAPAVEEDPAPAPATR